jgi:hypothetical protein
MTFWQKVTAVVSLILAYSASNHYRSTDTAIFLAVTLIIIAFGKKDKPE